MDVDFLSFADGSATEIYDYNYSLQFIIMINSLLELKTITSSKVPMTISMSPWHKKILALSHKILSKMYKFPSFERSCLTLVNIICPNSSAGIPVPSLSNLQQKFICEKRELLSIEIVK